MTGRSCRNPTVRCPGRQGIAGESTDRAIPKWKSENSCGGEESREAALRAERHATGAEGTLGGQKQPSGVERSDRNERPSLPPRYLGLSHPRSSSYPALL